MDNGDGVWRTPDHLRELFRNDNGLGNNKGIVLARSTQVGGHNYALSLDDTTLQAACVGGAVVVTTNSVTFTAPAEKCEGPVFVKNK
jgi:hypothetical protein